MTTLTEDATISLGEEADLPVLDVVTGRGFITGKSGSGKSNTASVVAEELLEMGVPFLVVDTDGEYWGLKDDYELLHAGADDDCDVTVTPEDAGTIVDVALNEEVPVVLDVSGYLDQAPARDLVERVVRHLFGAAKDAQEPFLLLVEEAHEFMPQSGKLDDAGETLIRVAKRGRKRGLGVCAMSQRPAAVDKNFVTQCDWFAWHRLTWENDLKVVGRVLGDDWADTVSELDTGEAVLMTDWDERTRRVQIRRKWTHDAGATPGVDDEVTTPTLTPVREDVIDRFAVTHTAQTTLLDDEEAAADDGSDDDDERAAGEFDDLDELDDIDDIDDIDDDVEVLDDPAEAAEVLDVEEGVDPLAPPSSGDDVKTVVVMDNRRRTKPQPKAITSVEAAQQERADDPLWEAAQLVVHLERAVVRRISGGIDAVTERIASLVGYDRPPGYLRTLVVVTGVLLAAYLALVVALTV